MIVSDSRRVHHHQLRQESHEFTVSSSGTEAVAFKETYEKAWLSVSWDAGNDDVKHHRVGPFKTDANGMVTGADVYLSNGSLTSSFVATITVTGVV